MEKKDIASDYSPIVLPNSTTPIISWQDVTVKSFKTFDFIQNIPKIITGDKTIDMKVKSY